MTWKNRWSSCTRWRHHKGRELTWEPQVESLRCPFQTKMTPRGIKPVAKARLTTTCLPFTEFLVDLTLLAECSEPFGDDSLPASFQWRYDRREQTCRNIRLILSYPSIINLSPCFIDGYFSLRMISNAHKYTKSDEHILQFNSTHMKNHHGEFPIPMASPDLPMASKAGSLTISWQRGNGKMTLRESQISWESDPLD